MPAPSAPARMWNRALQMLGFELRQLAILGRSNRPWQQALAAAVAAGLPIFIGAWYGALPSGLVASLGGLVFLYLPGTALSHRMAWLMACGFGLVAGFTLGILSHVHQPLTIPVLAVITTLVTMVCRFYAVPPPGSLFFVMAAAIGAYTPAQGGAALMNVGLVAMGSVLGLGIAFLYSLHALRRTAPVAAPAPNPSFDEVVLDSVVIGAFVGLSLAVAQLLQLPRPYWVPVSCLSVIQAASLRAVWDRQLHRIAGTALGLLLFWAIAATVPLTPWSVAAVLTLLSFLIEMLVVWHYGLAVVFITPLTMLLAEAPELAMASTAGLMRARMVDTVLGCLAGLAGGACLHSPRFRAVVGRWLRRILPVRA
ncbi:MAG TPA: FUSC family protein [Ramlibacter sp.]|nr:FUSC family protein [Ramlibacter sp.]